MQPFDTVFIDYGASRIKSIQYDIRTDTFGAFYDQESPFLQNEIIDISLVKETILQTLAKYDKPSQVYGCSIIGGGYVKDKYYSWKSIDSPSNGTCLISYLFKDQSTYHIHIDHDPKGDKEIKELGLLGGVKFYSILGDTNCVLSSIELKENSCLINLGTGSQFAARDVLIKYIPSGRSLNVFRSFFNTLGRDLFKSFNTLSLEDLNRSTISFDLNVFPQAHKYKTGGIISGITENDFTFNNFVSSMFRSYIDQYIDYIEPYDKVYLMGGISRKYPIIRDYLEYKTGKEVVVQLSDLEDTFVGIRNRIRR
jgi:hypothetical protein